MLRGNREYVDRRAAELQAKARAIVGNATALAAEVAALRTVPGASHPSEIDGSLHYATVHIAGIGGVLDPEPDAEEVARIARDLGTVTQDRADVRRLGERANALRRLRTLESAPASPDRDEALERMRREELTLRPSGVM